MVAAIFSFLLGKTPATFHALSKLPAGERADSTSLTDDQLASIEGASSWSDGVVIEQLTKGGGTNIALVRQQNGESVVVEQQIGGKSTTCGGEGGDDNGPAPASIVATASMQNILSGLGLGLRAMNGSDFRGLSSADHSSRFGPRTVQGQSPVSTQHSRHVAPPPFHRVSRPLVPVAASLTQRTPQPGLR